MNITQGQFHKPTWEDRIILCLQWAICALVIFILAGAGVNAWIIEDDVRIAKLKQHLWDVAYGRNTVAPAAPTGVRPNYGDKAEPKVRYFQDASQPKGGK
jgi:hypothetical protein